MATFSLTTIAGLAVSDGNIIVGDGGNWTTESGNDARTTLGLGTGDSPIFLSVALSEYLKLTSATRTGSAGEMWANTGGALHYVPVADDRTIQLADGVVTADTTVANTTTETTVFTENVSADELYAGLLVKCTVMGHYSTVNATDTFNLVFKLGSTTIQTKTSVAENVTNGPWKATLFFTVRSVGATGTVQAYTEGIFNDTHDDLVNTSATTIDTTAAEDITVTVQWTSANAGNTLTLSQGWCEFLGEA